MDIREICPVPNGETVVSMCQFRGDILIATDRHIYRLIDDGNECYLETIRFVEQAAALREEKS